MSAGAAVPRPLWRVSWVTPSGAQSRDFDSPSAAYVWASYLGVHAAVLRAFVSVERVRNDSRAASPGAG